MKQRNILPLFLALAIPCALPAKEAAPAIEPAAKALLEESVKAVGGKDALLKIKSRVIEACLLYTSPSPRDRTRSRMPSSA